MTKPIKTFRAYLAAFGIDSRATGTDFYILDYRYQLKKNDAGRWIVHRFIIGDYAMMIPGPRIAKEFPTKREAIDAICYDALNRSRDGWGDKERASWKTYQTLHA